MLGKKGKKKKIKPSSGYGTRIKTTNYSTGETRVKKSEGYISSKPSSSYRTKKSANKTMVSKVTKGGVKKVRKRT